MWKISLQKKKKKKENKIKIVDMLSTYGKLLNHLAYLTNLTDVQLNKSNSKMDTKSILKST